ncbi:unnamed protein product, partial [Porites lobata]
WLIVKTSEVALSAKKAFGDEVNITLEGGRPLGAVIRSKEFNDHYCQEKVDKWLREMESLTEISKSQPHAAYVAFTKDLNPNSLITCAPSNRLKRQFNASLDITAPHVNSIVTQSSTIPARELMEERKREIRRAAAKSRIKRIDESLSPDLLQAVQQTRDKGASSWLNTIPIEEHGLALNKQKFKDSLCLRYNLPLPNLPSFVAQRHDTMRDLLTSHISKVCRNVETEPLLQPLDNEVFNLQSTVKSREARLDMKAGGFWTTGVRAFFDVRGKYTATIFKEQENEKKRKYNQRVMDVAMGTFTRD